MRPVAQPDGHDGPGLSFQLVPGATAVIEQIVYAAEHAIGEPVLAYEL